MRVTRRAILSQPCATCSVSALDGACEGNSSRDAHLVEDIAQVRLDGLLAEEQLGSDLGIGLAVDDEPRDLRLAPGERADTNRGPRAWAGSTMDMPAELS